MRLHLKSVRWQNFLSFGNQWTEVELDKHATTLIVGKNGAGKSTLIDAISFALFNKPFRDINKPQLASSLNKHQCLVELAFSINGHDFQVRRGIRPTLFEIYKDGELITEAADTRDYQDAFEKHILRVNHKTFSQIVMLGSATFSPFMALKAPERRAIIEDLLDLKVFSRMNTLLKDQVSETEKLIEGWEAEKKLLEEKITLTTRHVEQMKIDNEDQIKVKKKFIEETFIKFRETENQITTLQNEIQEYAKDTADLKQVNSRLAELTKIQTQLQQKSGSLKREVSFLTNNDSCPTCHQEIEEDFKQKTTFEKSKVLGDIDGGLKKLRGLLEEVQLRLNAISHIQNEINVRSNKIIELQQGLRYYQTAVDNTKKEIETLSQKKVIDASGLVDWLIEKDRLQADILAKRDEEHVMSFASQMLKDTGIKAQIIKTYVPIINQLIQKYLACLDFFVEFQLDENFKETIKSRFRDNFTYASFSEGEKARLNLAILFTWRALAKLRGSIDVNLIVFDEIFDGSLDIDGSEAFLKLIQSLTMGENIVMISHKVTSYEDKFSRVLHVEKTKNFSQIRG
jgi:DNA repair exonuclease SbcCD ATPase subunit